MATTASVGRTGLLTGPNSAFDQFRVSITSPNAMNAIAHQAASAVPPSRSTQDHSQPVTSQSPAGAGTGSANLELVEVISNSNVEGVLQPNKDGRVRNPVPSKLKGKTDNRQGNFGVMHMGASPGKKIEGQGSQSRDEAARRTSENTANRAKMAQSEKYVPPSKKKESTLGAHIKTEGQSANRGSPFAVSRERSRPLAPDETKYEQARLLTLLRSINPVTVVDQICKAVAYFGGIPGAPPPEDGIFPESANTRETGALFIGWLAEIFPDVAAKSPEVPKEVILPGTKKKGRPGKGNKALPAVAAGEAGTQNEPPNSRNGYGYGPAVSAPLWGLPTSLDAVISATPAPVLPGATVASVAQTKQSEQQSPNTPAKVQLDDQSGNAASANKRSRGRPKGSRNKGKVGEGSESANNTDGQTMGHDVPESPEAQASVAKVAQMKAPSFTPIQNNQTGAAKSAQALQYSDQSWQNNVQPDATNHTSNMSVPDEFSPEERAVLEAFRHQNTDAMNLMPSPVVPVKTGSEVGQKRKRPPPKPKATPIPPKSFPTASPQVQQNFQTASPQIQQNFQTASPQLQQNFQTASPQLQQKFQTASPQLVQNSSLTMPTAPSHETSIGMAKDALQWASVDNTTTVQPPPAKKARQRKPKAPPAVEPPSRTQTASVVSASTPTLPPSTIPDSQATTSGQSIFQQSMQSNMQQSQPVSRPPAEGLEAHYERFQTLQQQQNGRSHTPTQSQQVQQLPQQQARQQSKPSPAPLQQSIPQAQQIQHQKSQQGNQQSNSLQRDDQKSSQVNSARPSSTTYYNQRAQTSNAYGQQYPSQQSSNLYGTHQASPQMSTNSYRTSSTHTLAQASPQLSQAENTYRTASPHTIAQPSPAFSQPDTTTRNTTTTNYLAQPSPAFSQAENSYRTPSTHSMAQSTPSYTTSRSHTQPQQTAHTGPYGQFSESPYIDLPTLESLGHTGSSTSNVGINTGYGQGGGMGLGNTSRSSTSNSLYGSSSGLNNFDPGAHDLLRGVSRSTSHSNTAYSNTGYGSTSSGLHNAFDTTADQQELRERLMRGIGRR